MILSTAKETYSDAYTITFWSDVHDEVPSETDLFHPLQSYHPREGPPNQASTRKLSAIVSEEPFVLNINGVHLQARGCKTTRRTRARTECYRGQWRTEA